MRVALGQFAPTKGRTEANLDRIAELTTAAITEGADLVVFPEACTSGYFLEGGVTASALTPAHLSAELSRRLPDATPRIVVGHYEVGADFQIYNSATLLAPSKGGESLRAVHTHRKLFLPTYGVFDEERFVGRGDRLDVVPLNEGLPTALLICEDVWHAVLPTIAALKGAHLMIVPSASPAREFTTEDGTSHIGNHASFARIARTISQEHGVFVVNAQLVGFEGGKGLVGGSLITDPFGRIVAEAPIGKEALLLADLDLDLVAIARAQVPMLSDLQTMWPRLKDMMADIQ